MRRDVVSVSEFPNAVEGAGDLIRVEGNTCQICRSPLGGDGVGIDDAVGCSAERRCSCDVDSFSRETPDRDDGNWWWQRNGCGKSVAL